VQYNATGFRHELIERKRHRNDLISSMVRAQISPSTILIEELSKFMLEYKNVSQK
jgi:hypothetical protein